MEVQRSPRIPASRPGWNLGRGGGRCDRVTESNRQAGRIIRAQEGLGCFVTGPGAKLSKARQIIERELRDQTKGICFDEDLERLKITLKDGLLVYIQFNNYGEYSYSIIMAGDKGDYCRFDNYDDRWDVDTRPHHFHPRFHRHVQESQMIGDPDTDIPLLVRFLKGKQFFKT